VLAGNRSIMDESLWPSREIPVEMPCLLWARPVNWNGGGGGNGAYYNSNLVNQMFTNMDSLIWRLRKYSEATTENFLLFRRQEEQFLPGSFQQMVWNRLAT